MNDPFTYTGVLKKVLEKESGVSSGGYAWQRLTFVLSDGGRDDAAFTLLNSKVDEFESLLLEGYVLHVGFTVSSREWNGKFYTSLVAVSVALAGQEPSSAPRRRKSKAPRISGLDCPGRPSGSALQGGTAAQNGGDGFSAASMLQDIRRDLAPKSIQTAPFQASDLPF